MTPSFTNVKIFSSLVLDGFFNALTRYRNCFFHFKIVFLFLCQWLFFGCNHVIGRFCWFLICIKKNLITFSETCFLDYVIFCLSCIRLEYEIWVKGYVFSFTLWLIWFNQTRVRGGITKRNKGRSGLYERQDGTKVRGRQQRGVYVQGFVGARSCHWLLQTREHQRDWPCRIARDASRQKNRQLIPTQLKKYCFHLVSSKYMGLMATEYWCWYALFSSSWREEDLDSRLYHPAMKSLLHAIHHQEFWD